MSKRVLQLDFYRKSLSIRGGIEGIVFEVRGAQIKSWDQDPNEHALVRVTFSGASAQEFSFGDPADYPKVAEALTEFRDCCLRRRGQHRHVNPRSLFASDPQSPCGASHAHSQTGSAAFATCILD
jgi:hypothetical protein